MWFSKISCVHFLINGTFGQFKLGCTVALNLSSTPLLMGLVVLKNQRYLEGGGIWREAVFRGRR